MGTWVSLIGAQPPSEVLKPLRRRLDQLALLGGRVVVRRGVAGQVRPRRRAGGARQRRGGKAPRPPRADLRPVGRRPRRRLPELTGTQP